MTSIYLLKDDKVLLLFRKDGRVVSDVWTGSAGGHFEEFELNDAKACVLREMNEELGLCEDNIRNLSLRSAIYSLLPITNIIIRISIPFSAH